MAKVVDGEIVFSSGRRAYCFNGLFSCNEDDNEWGISYGSDGGLYWPNNQWLPEEHRLTDSDIRELVEMMIARWQKLLTKLEP